VYARLTSAEIERLKRLKIGNQEITEEKLLKLIIEDKEEEKRRLDEEKAKLNKDRKRDYFKDLYSDDRDFISDENRFLRNKEKSKKDPFFRKDINEIKDKLKQDKAKAITVYHQSTNDRKNVKKGVK